MIPAHKYIEPNIKAWVAALIDTSRRNNLLYLTTGRTDRYLALGGIQDAVIHDLLAGKALQLKRIKTEEETDILEQKLGKIVRKAQENLEEKGLQTLYLTLGAVSWPSEDKGRDYYAPALLLPLQWTQDRTRRLVFSVEWAQDADINRSLQVVWNQAFQIQMPSIDTWLGDSMPAAWADILQQTIPDYIRAQGSIIEGLTWHDDCHIGNFSFQKMAMVQDIESAKAELEQHPLLAALCGDPDAIQSMQQSQHFFDSSTIDSLPAEDDFTFLPSDSSQFTAIRSVLGGWNGVIQGPPGTGKSQTIANLIGELIARGKKVLFVAEKKAALDVVHTRLDRAGLSDMILDLHGNELSRKQFQQQLRQAMSVMDTPPAGAQGNHVLWSDTRKRLNRHAELFHAPIAPWQDTARDLMEFLQATDKKEYVRLRIAASAWEAIHAKGLDAWFHLIQNALALHQKWASDAYTGWRSLRITQPNTPESLLTFLESFASHIRDYHRLFKKIPQLQRLQPATRVEELGDFLKLCADHNAVQQAIKMPLPLAEVQLSLQVLKRVPAAGIGNWWAGLFNSEYKQVKSKLDAALQTGFHHATARQVLTQYETLLASGHFETMPFENIADMPVIESCIADLLKDVSQMDALLQVDSGKQQERLISEYAAFAEACLLRPEGGRIHAQWQQSMADFDNAGLLPLLEKVLKKGMDADTAFTWLKRLRAHMILDYWQGAQPDFLTFSGEVQTAHQQAFRRLDADKMQLAAHRIRRAHAENLVKVLNAHPDQQHLLRQQVGRKRVRPVKQMMQDAPDSMMALFPCWMASPLSVTSLLDGRKVWFDVVLFDEASQVKPEDAICSIMRGRQLVVAGDTRQLPPTAFFASGDSEEDLTDAAPATSGYESLLDMMFMLPGQGNLQEGWFLQWHYRSRDEALIAFANQEIYGNRMITFPRPSTHPAVHHIQVEPTPSDVNPASDSQEVIAVVELIFQLARQHPEKSLGVIALGIQHALRIEMLIDAYMQRYPELQSFFDRDREDPFFVKNLERVQGDERDIIIISVGYGQDRTGRLSMNFGPLTQTGGERRLNVAITRSRQQMYIVSSFGPGEIDLSRTKSRGMELLKGFLEYARSNGRNLQTTRFTEFPENVFEYAIRVALEAEGLVLSTQIGVSSYRIDLAVHHPDRPGEFIMGIECDGASYHSAQGARDRDRLRQEHLEALGWRIVRIWSTDWFYQKEQEVQRIVKIYHAFLSEAHIPESKTDTEISEVNIEATALASDRAEMQPVKPRPNVPIHSNIDQYSNTQLILLMDWIRSDGRLRTKEQMVEDMTQELGFSRTGARIRRRIEGLM